MSSALCLRLLLPLAIALTILPRTARAQEVTPLRPATLVFDERQQLRVSIAYRDVVDGPTSAKLMGGLPTTIVLRAYVFNEAGGPSVALAFKACRVIFDLWDEVYRIEISQAGASDTVAASPTVEGVLRRCAEAERLPVVARAALPPGSKYYVGCIVDVNPLSPDMLDRIKRWVSRPTGAPTSAPGDALFGSFVGLFVTATRIGAAERQVMFRTQSFTP